jgi:hypothetical protein
LPFWVIKHIIGNEPTSSWRTRHNHELQWPDGQLEYWHYSNEGQRYRTLSTAEAQIEVYLSTNEPKSLTDKYFRATKILDAGYKKLSEILDDFIKTCENIHVEKQHQLKISNTLDNWVSSWWKIRRIQHGSRAGN